MLDTLVPDTSSFEVGMSTEKLERYKSPSTGQTATQIIQSGDKILCSEIHKRIHSIWNIEELSHQ
jgi:hypothetical protein